MPDSMMQLTLMDLGITDYQQALLIQEECHENIKSRNSNGYLICVEHPPTITWGNRGKTSSLISSEATLDSQGIRLVETSRGGDITAHNPGQLVFYPIIKLSKGIGPKKLVCLMEHTTIDVLQTYGITAHRSALNAGVWIDKSKIASIGIRVRHQITTHGLSLNVCNDLRIFEHIIACGIREAAVTSMLQAGVQGISTQQIKMAWVQNFAKQVGYAIS